MAGAWIFGSEATHPDAGFPTMMGSQIRYPPGDQITPRVCPRVILWTPQGRSRSTQAPLPRMCPRRRINSRVPSATLQLNYILITPLTKKHPKKKRQVEQVGNRVWQLYVSSSGFAAHDIVDHRNWHWCEYIELCSLT